MLIGVRCGGVLEENELPEAVALTPENVAPRCYGCDNREPALVDHLVGESQPEPPRPAMTIDERVAALDAQPLEERWAFWTEQFSKCVRCYACRQVCPLCVCERCVADKTQPQWIETIAAPARQPELEHHARPAPRRPLRRLRRVRALLPGRHPAHAS